MIKIKGYTNEELEYIKNNYGVMTVQQLSEKLNKTYNSIYNAVRKLGIKKQIHKQWTEEENNYLKENYLYMTNEEMSKILKRTFNSISAQMDRLNLIRNKAWSKEEEEYLKNNFINMTHKEIGEILGRTEQAVRAKCFDLNLYKMEVPWSDYELTFLKENYKEMTNKEIAKILNRTENAIHLQGSRMGIKKYPYTCDYHYFDQIDTEEKAYWLGFLTADGWINKSGKTNSCAIGIEIQYKDLEHLKKFNKSIHGNYKITDRWRECNISKYKDRKTHSCIIRIYSTNMYNSLCDLGFNENKSFSAKMPNIEDDLIRHYIRGYFDGNGTLCFTNKSFKVGFTTASKHFNCDLLKLLKIKGFNIIEFNYVNEFGTTIYSPNIERIKDKIKFLDWLYKDSNIYLDRKYKKYLKIKKKYITE